MPLRQYGIGAPVTTDRSVQARWAREMAGRLGMLFPVQRVTVRPVDVLPPLASLSGDLGWKLSRVLDFEDERMWHRVSPAIATGTPAAIRS